MKKMIWAVMFSIILLGCGSSSDDFKYYSGIKVTKSGTISLIGDELSEKELTGEFHKVYFDKKGRVTKEFFLNSGHAKRSSNYLYDKDGKIDQVRHYTEGKYNGVSKYIYGDDGTIVKEEVYDKDFNFLYSKAF